MLKPLIQRSWEAAQRVPGIASVHVVTDHPSIAEAARRFGANVLMTSSRCRNGTERCAEAVGLLDQAPDIVVNLQGDAPLTPPRFVADLVAALAGRNGEFVATPSVRCSADHVALLQAEEAAGRVGGTSVVSTSSGRALYFSKRLIPHFPTQTLHEGTSPVRLHIGVYAYTPAALRAYQAAAPSQLEELEGLEQLRFLDCDIPMQVVELVPPEWQLWELNNPSDVAPIEEALARMHAE